MGNAGFRRFKGSSHEICYLTIEITGSEAVLNEGEERWGWNPWNGVYDVVRGSAGRGRLLGLEGKTNDFLNLLMWFLQVK